MTQKHADDHLEEQLNRMAVGLMKHLDKRFAEVSEHLNRIESRISTLEGGVDQVLKNQETDEQERLAANHQISRHEDWIEKAAPAVGISYDPAA